MSAWRDAGFLIIVPVHMFDQGILEAENQPLNREPLLCAFGMQCN